MNAQSVINLARTQIGVTESPSGSNRQKYGAWYGTNGVKWCMIFVQWIFAHSGLLLPYKTASCSSLLTWYRKNHPGQVHSEPEIGDIAIFDWGHTGIVTETGLLTIKTIEGNTSSSIIGSQDNGGGVYERTRLRANVTAFIRPYKEEVKKVNVTLNVLKKGSKGDQVRTLQTLLNAYGYNCGKADGDFGKNTDTALRKYQSAKKLTADGICGQATWNSLLGAV